MAVKYDKETLNFPGPENRILIVGRTGSGKSVAGLFHLSRANFTEMPWTIIDSKGEAEFRNIHNLNELPLDAEPQRKPGLYIVRPGQSEQDWSELQEYLGKVHANGRHGLFIDEGYMVFPSKPISWPLRSIFTQGRSRLTPVIINSQRPTWIDRFAVSEASFFQVFDLTDDKDRKRLQEFIPRTNVDLMQDFGKFKSVYHDVSGKITRIIKPLRPAEESVKIINQRLDKLYRTRSTVKLKVV